MRQSGIGECPSLFSLIVCASFVYSAFLKCSCTNVWSSAQPFRVGHHLHSMYFFGYKNARRIFLCIIFMNSDLNLVLLLMLCPGMLYWQQGAASVKTGTDTSQEFVTAHSMLSDAVRHRPDNHRGWYYLGLVCKAQGQQEDAKKFLQNAVSLAASSPVESFSILPRLF